MKKIIPILVIGVLVFSGFGVAAITNNKATTITNSLATTDNQPPNVPEITGPVRPKIGVTYCYTIVTTDPDVDDVSYYIDWGDGTVTDWIGPYPSGNDAAVSHAWYKSGSYIVGCKAKDYPYEAESELRQYLIIVPPKSKVLAGPLFFQIVQRLLNTR